MRARSGTLGSAMALAALCALSLAGALSALFLGLAMDGRLDSSNFSIRPAIVPHVGDSMRAIKVAPLKSKAFSKAELEGFTKRMIVEYIAMRYTVNGSEYLMGRALGIYGDGGGTPMKVLGSPGAYAKFQQEEAEGIRALMIAKTTRAVSITDGPRRHADRWITGVEFIYREPGTANLAAARRERWDIHMEVEEVAKFREMGPAVYEFPSTAFGFRVNWLGKYEPAKK